MSVLSPAIIRDYIAHRRTQKRTVGKQRTPIEGASDETIRNELATLRAALNHMRKEGWLAEVPHIELPPKPLPVNAGSPARKPIC